jgi:hypothetical protein
MTEYELAKVDAMRAVAVALENVSGSLDGISNSIGDHTATSGDPGAALEEGLEAIAKAIREWTS